MSSPTPSTAPTEPTEKSATPPSPACVALDRDDEKLREVLKRCSPATYEAACAFRRTRNVQFVPVLVHGIIERYIERELRPKLSQGDDTLRLVEDLGLDSLTRMEIVLLAEEVLPITIDNEDLCQLRTLGDLKRRVTECIAAFQAGAVSSMALPGLATVGPGHPAPASAPGFAAPQVPLASR